MDRRLGQKLSHLRERIRKLDSALVAFSGGVDSAFLMRICREELGEKAVAVTALSDNYPGAELSMARRVAKIIGVKHLVLDPARPAGASPPPRLPACRGANVYSTLRSVAMRMKLKHVLDGSHRDDAYEQGKHFMAARHAGVRSPLLESDLTKAEIRLLAKELGLPNWDKPSSGNRKQKTGNRKRSKDVPLARLRRQLAEEYLKSLSRGIRLRVSRNKVYILAGRNAMVALARRFSAIKRKMKSLGFSEVLLKMA
jgi:uncharacterized protein